MSYKLCPECGQPMLKAGQKRQHPDDYRHARGCPLDRSLTPEQLAALRYSDLTEHQQRMMRTVKRQGGACHGGNKRIGRLNSARHLTKKGLLREWRTAHWVPADEKHPIWQEVQDEIEAMDRKAPK